MLSHTCALWMWAVFSTFRGYVVPTSSEFNDANSNSDYTTSKNWMIVNNELERMSEEAVVA
jgi:hypothetical protein